MNIKRILVAQPKPEKDKSQYWDLERKYNLKFDFYKLFETIPVSASEFRKQRVRIPEYSAVIFASKTSVDHFFRICKEMRILVPESLKYFCISESSAFYIQKYIQYRKRKIFTGNENLKELIEIVKKHREEKYLLPCSDLVNLDITRLLTTNKINYSRAIIYKNKSLDISHLVIEDYDLLVLFSSSDVLSLFANFPKYKQEETLIAAWGNSTIKTAKKYNLKISIEGPKPKITSMPFAIEQFILKQDKKDSIKVK